MKKIQAYLNRNFLKIKADNPDLKKQYVCPLCQDRGITIVGDLAYKCSCQKQRSLLKNFSSANMTQVLAANTFERFELGYYSPHVFIEEGGPSYRAMAQKALEGAQLFVANYLEGKNPLGVMYIGQVGSGKTFLAGAITNALLEHGRQVLFLVVPDFLDDLRATYQKQGEFSEAELMDAARKAEVLILDDLGAHNFTEWTQNKIFSLVNFRLNHGLPIIITTNLLTSEMNQVVGERTVSRIIEMCRIYRMYVEKDIRTAMRRC